NNEENKPFFHRVGIKSKIKKQKKEEKIQGVLCSVYNFKNKISEGINQNYESGKCWIEKQTGNVMLIQFKYKLCFILPFIIYARGNNEIKYVYEANKLTKIVSNINMTISIPFLKSNNNMQIIETNFN
ncbi:MAG: hypothetical protein MJB14_15565, partial [Spirochaetes bacterium]|nr:hypothetical protein [Spirochaetota bacterium]